MVGVLWMVEILVVLQRRSNFSSSLIAVPSLERH